MRYSLSDTILHIISRMACVAVRNWSFFIFKLFLSIPYMHPLWLVSMGRQRFGKAAGGALSHLVNDIVPAFHTARTLNQTYLASLAIYSGVHDLRRRSETNLLLDGES
ncbi:hypothetical protein LY78DRAFT_495833 [Colletotrichum sublineola]|nr:hypothetical protein LY78DRAFT_495833 [Colletotrichum sublineola]